MYLTQGLHRAARQSPSGIAVIFAERKTTYAQLLERVQRFASALVDLGLKPGERVGLISLNSEAYVEYYLAVWWAGGVVNPINTRWSVAEIAYSLDDSQTEILLMDEAFAPLASDIRAKSSCLKTVATLGCPSSQNDVVEMDSLIDGATAIADRCPGGDALAGIFYTGGTTGHPKGVMLSHTNLWTSVIARMATIHSPQDSVALHCAPLFHLAAAGRLIGQLTLGATSVLLPQFRVNEVLDCIERHQVSEATLVPSMLQMLMDDAAFSSEKFTSLRRVTYGASPMPGKLLGRLAQELPFVEIVQSYGQTEASPVISLNATTPGKGIPDARFKSAGRATLSIELRILEAQGQEAPPRTIGEITVKGPGVMLGYWNKPQETAQALQNGWLHTGDLGYLDEDGYLFIVDRLKDMIISGGENIYSAEVENALSLHPAVSQCAIIGVPHDVWGECVHAVIVLKSGYAATDVQLLEHCQTLIAKYKCPKSFEFADTLPLSSTGKVLKVNLRRAFAAQHEGTAARAPKQKST